MTVRLRESHIEQAVCKYAEARGWEVRKMTGRRGMPDRLFFRQGRILFIEFKRPGGVVSPLQAREIRTMRNHGLTVYVIDSIENARHLFE